MSESSINCKIFEKCVKSYKDLINCDEGSDYKMCLKSCIDNFSNILQMDDLTNQYITSNLFGKCVLLNNKKTDYYKFTYNVDSIIKKIKDNQIKLKEDFLENFLKMFNTNKYDNCCNCVNIVLYYTDCIDTGRLFLYLPNVLATLNNIEKYLPNWILRLYLDRTLFETLYNNDFGSLNYHERSSARHNLKLLINLLKKISESKQCEINILFCEEFYKDNFAHGKLRTLRFSSFYDESTNIVASREADGILSAVDCHNLSVLENGDFIMSFYILPHVRKLEKSFSNLKSDSGDDVEILPPHQFFNDSLYVLSEDRFHFSNVPFNTNSDNTDKKQILTYEYSEWLNNYKKIDIVFNDNPFYLNHINIYPMLAGVVSLKCKFNKSYFEQIQNKIKCTMQSYEKYNTDENILSLLSDGYDEILLQELFRPMCYLEYDSVIDDNFKIELEKLQNSFSLAEDKLQSTRDPETYNEVENELSQLYEEIQKYKYDMNNIDNKKITIKKLKFLITELLVLISPINTHTITFRPGIYVVDEPEFDNNVNYLITNDIQIYNELTDKDLDKFILSQSIFLLNVESGYQLMSETDDDIELEYDDEIIYNYKIYEQLENKYKESLTYRTKYLKYKTKYLNLKKNKNIKI